MLSATPAANNAEETPTTNGSDDAIAAGFAAVSAAAAAADIEQLRLCARAVGMAIEQQQMPSWTDAQMQATEAFVNESVLRWRLFAPAVSHDEEFVCVLLKVCKMMHFRGISLREDVCLWTVDLLTAAAASSSQIEAFEARHSPRVLLHCKELLFLLLPHRLNAMLWRLGGTPVGIRALWHVSPVETPSVSVKCHIFGSLLLLLAIAKAFCAQPAVSCVWVLFDALPDLKAFVARVRSSSDGSFFKKQCDELHAIVDEAFEGRAVVWAFLRATLLPHDKMARIAAEFGALWAACGTACIADRDEHRLREWIGTLHRGNTAKMYEQMVARLNSDLLDACNAAAAEKEARERGVTEHRALVDAFEKLAAKNVLLMQRLADFEAGGLTPVVSSKLPLLKLPSKKASIQKAVDVTPKELSASPLAVSTSHVTDEAHSSPKDSHFSVGKILSSEQKESLQLDHVIISQPDAAFSAAIEPTSTPTSTCCSAPASAASLPKLSLNLKKLKPRIESPSSSSFASVSPLSSQSSSSSQPLSPPIEVSAESPPPIEVSGGSSPIGSLSSSVEEGPVESAAASVKSTAALPKLSLLKRSSAAVATVISAPSQPPEETRLLPVLACDAPLKQINWNKVERSKLPSSRVCLWTDAGTSKAEVAPPSVLKNATRLAEIYRLFSKGGENSKPGSPVGSLSMHNLSSSQSLSSTSSTNLVMLLDAKRSKNIAIVLSQFRSIPLQQLVDRIARMQIESFSVDSLLILQQNLPSADEMGLVAQWAASNDESILALAERFTLACSRVPFFALRLACLLLHKRLAGELAEFAADLRAIGEVADCVVKSQNLRVLLRVVLEVGNALNAKSFRGEASGFKLDVLNKLSDVKVLNGRNTLFEYVVLTASSVLSVAALADEGALLEAASKVSLGTLNAHINAFVKTFEDVRQQVENTISSAPSSTSVKANAEDTFFIAAPAIIQQVGASVAQLRDSAAATAAKASKAVEYFCEESFDGLVAVLLPFYREVSKVVLNRVNLDKISHDFEKLQI